MFHCELESSSECAGSTSMLHPQTGQVFTKQNKRREPCQTMFCVSKSTCLFFKPSYILYSKNICSWGDNYLRVEGYSSIVHFRIKFQIIKAHFCWRCCLLVVAEYHVFLSTLVKFPFTKPLTEAAIKCGNFHSTYQLTHSPIAHNYC